MNGELYREMLTHSLFDEIEAENLDNIWFQQYDARCHTANPIIKSKSNNQQNVAI